jgi:hypothetical protein
MHVHCSCEHITAHAHITVHATGITGHAHIDVHTVHTHVLFMHCCSSLFHASILLFMRTSLPLTYLLSVLFMRGYCSGKRILFILTCCSFTHCCLYCSCGYIYCSCLYYRSVTDCCSLLFMRWYCSRTCYCSREQYAMTCYSCGGSKTCNLYICIGKCRSLQK